jgi:hypothetical protein
VTQSEHINAYFKEFDRVAREVDYQATIQRKAHGLAGEQHMATNRQENNQEQQSSPWPGFARFLFIVVVTVLLYVLVSSMVRHHFYSGGQMNQHEVTGP